MKLRVVVLFTVLSAACGGTENVHVAAPPPDTTGAPEVKAVAAKPEPSAAEIDEALKAAYVEAKRSYEVLRNVGGQARYTDVFPKTNRRCEISPGDKVVRVSRKTLVALGAEKPRRMEPEWATAPLWETQAIRDMPPSGQLLAANENLRASQVLAGHAAVKDASHVLVAVTLFALPPDHYDGMFVPGRVDAIVLTHDAKRPSRADCFFWISAANAERHVEAWTEKDQQAAEEELLQNFTKALVTTSYFRSGTKPHPAPSWAEFVKENGSVVAPVPVVKPLPRSQRTLGDIPAVQFAPALDVTTAGPDDIAKRIDLAAGYAKEKPTRALALLAEIARGKCSTCRSAVDAALADVRFQTLWTDQRFVELALIGNPELPEENENSKEVGRSERGKKTGAWVKTNESDYGWSMRLFVKGRQRGPRIDFGMFGRGYGRGVYLNQVQTMAAGKRHGPYLKADSDQTVTTGSYVRGKKDGRWTTVKLNGPILRVESFRAGVRHGEDSGYDANGKQLYKNELKNGSGPWRRYRDAADGLHDDELHEQGQLKASKRVGKWTISYRTQKNDSLRTEKGSYVAGKREGEWVVSEQDREIGRGHYRADKLHGKWQVKDEKRSEILEFSNGKLIKVNGERATRDDHWQFEHDMYDFPDPLRY
jgi:antitoxin component YwqK of YwqJK toxin-antitoxin module